jgi:Raf kinase inhibitor-like YbhB/YbcL family protein
MKRITLLVGLFAMVAMAAAAREVMELTVTSSAFQNNGPIPQPYTCEGKQTSPPLSWSELPPQTRSIAVIIDDLDAPGGTFVHLVLYNLPPTERSLASQPARGIIGHGAAALNSNHDSGWAPICPPSGTHHYRFIVFGLDTMLQLPARATSREVEQSMGGHVVARGELVGTYQKGAAAKPLPARPYVK